MAESSLWQRRAGIFLTAAALMAPCISPAATITFQNLQVFGGISNEQTEDGMRYVLSQSFNVYPFRGNPPSSLVASAVFDPTPFGNPAVFVADDARPFTFDSYDVSSFEPPQQGDSWLFRGVRENVEQFSFFDSTNGPFSTRITGQSELIDRLEIFSTSRTAAAALLVDNLRFTIHVPEPGSFAIILLGMALIGSMRVRRHH